MKKTIPVIYHETFQALKSQKKLMLPFLIFACVESMFLTLIYVAPRQPFVAVFGPPIRTFRGEMFLHYPANFLLIPELSSISRTILTVLIGSLLSGVAAILVSQAFAKKSADLKSAFSESLKKYGQLFTVILIFALVIHYAYKIFRFRGPLALVVNLAILIVIQMFLVYAVPFLMIGKEKLFKSIWRSIVFAGKNIWQSLLIVFIPFIAYIPIVILQYKTAYLIDNVFPEAVLIVAYLSVILSSLVVDMFVTVSATLYYLNNKEG